MTEKRDKKFFYLTFFIALCCGCFFSFSVEALDFTQLSLEELMAVEVTSVSKKKQSMADSATAIFVITREDIKKSGVTSVQDALRMVPGFHVGRIDSNKWGVNSRGFNGRFAYNLLVFIDGRSVYSPSFSGVYWENNDVFMEDIERIEVIRGPGGTIWGANAVNGVVNIITRNSKETQGGYLEFGTGNREKIIAGARYGSSIGSETFWRIYAKNRKWGEFDLDSGGQAGDNWGMNQAGFRMDSAITDRDDLQINGDIYKGTFYDKAYIVTDSFPFMSAISSSADVSGGNLNVKWERTLAEKSNFKLSFCYDTASREEVFIEEARSFFYFDFQHRFSVGSINDIVWGAGYRLDSDYLKNTSILKIDSEDKKDNFFTAFFQDEISFFKDRLFLTIGSKFEKNEYTGFEIQPGVKLLWRINDEHRLWTSVSKAVKLPSRVEVSSTVKGKAFDSGEIGLIHGVPLISSFLPDPDKESLELIAYEAGYRFMKSDIFSMDLSLFFNDYQNIRGTVFEPLTYDGKAFHADLSFASNLNAYTYGGELSLNFIPMKIVRCNLGYSFIETDFQDGMDYGAAKHQISLRTGVNILPELSIDVWIRYVDKIKAITTLKKDGAPFYEMDDYTSLDLHIGWDIRKDLTLTVVGQNLLEKDNLEFIADTFTLFTRTPRMFYLKLSYRF